jgi:DnaK suppressor protein
VKKPLKTSSKTAVKKTSTQTSAKGKTATPAKKLSKAEPVKNAKTVKADLKKASAKPAAKPVAKPVPKASKPAPKAVAKPENKPATKPAIKPATKVVTKPAKTAVKAATVKAAAKPVAKPVAKVAAKPAAKPATKPVAKPTAKPVAKAAPKAAAKPVTKPAAKAPANAPAKAPVKAAPKTAPKAVAKPAAKVEVKPVDKAAPKVSAKAAPKAEPKVDPKAAAKAPEKAAKSATNLVPAAPAAATPAPTGDVPARAVRPSARLAQITVPSMAQSVASTAAKASYLQNMPSPVITPPHFVAVKKDPKLANNWKTKKPDQLTDAEVMAMSDNDYMNDAQMAFFRHKLVLLKQGILANAGETTEHLREDTVVVPDPADRATIEEEHALELRTRDRERKLLKKIEQSIQRIDAGDYGYCDETGEPIGVGRLLARPTASLSLEAQQRRELKQKMFGD